MKFEWDSHKAAANLRKHRVSFEEAQTIFDDPHLIIAYDDEHSEIEHRHRATGLSERVRLLTLCVCRVESSIRIINARKATAREVSDYAEDHS